MSKNTIYGILCILGFIFLIGTAGALEHDAISFRQAIFQSGVGLAVFAGAGWLGGFID